MNLERPNSQFPPSPSDRRRAKDFRIQKKSQIRMKLTTWKSLFVSINKEWKISSSARRSHRDRQNIWLAAQQTPTVMKKLSFFPFPKNGKNPLKTESEREIISQGDGKLSQKNRQNKQKLTEIYLQRLKISRRRNWEHEWRNNVGLKSAGSARWWWWLGQSF